MQTHNDDTILTAAPESTESTETSAPPAKPAPKRVGKSAKRAAAKAKAADAKPAKRGAGIPLKQILDELGLEPDGKLARRKLRAAKFDWHGHNERWVFTAKQAAKAREILGG